MKSFVYAFSGIASAVRGERNMRIHLLAAVAAVSLGAWLGLSACEWTAVVICCALVMSLECLNTAIEAAVDLASPDIHPLAKKAKDCAAGAVLIAAIGSAIVGCIIFAPKVVRFSHHMGTMNVANVKMLPVPNPIPNSPTPGQRRTSWELATLELAILSQWQH